jgi:RHS repeat-associated protein
LCFAYDLQGRLASVTSTTSNSSTITRTGYKYDSTGTRIGSAQSTATTQQPTNFILQSTLEYLTDSHNPTGYSQVLQETEFRSSGQAVKKTIYTVGHDQISQSVLNWVDANPYGAPAGWSAASTQYFGTDGHGSVRVLYDMTAAIVRNQTFVIQLYNFDAYGNLLGWTNAKPLTSYLYSGESFDFNIGQQYLRARFYDATTGRFTGLDPFYGNSSDPQSLHKYAYVHGDPISHVDPNGEFAAVLLGIGVSMMMAGPGDYIKGGLEALVRAYVVNLEWDVQWALDMSQPDDWGSRLDDKWVYAALGQGLHDQFNIDTPFGTFNPLDLFGGSSADASSFAARNTRAPNNVRFSGGGRASHSAAWDMPYTKGGKTLWSRVSLYEHPKLGRKIALFDDALSPVGTIPITYSRPPGGKKWSDLSDNEVGWMRRQDFAAAERKLDRLGVRYTKDGDNVVINGVKYTWHHHHHKGKMQLIPREVHEKIGHIGMAIWHQY